MKTIRAKLGPLPVWAWALIGVVLIIIAYLIYRSRQSSTAAPASSGGTIIAPGSLGTVTSAIAGPQGAPGTPGAPGTSAAQYYPNTAMTRASGSPVPLLGSPAENFAATFGGAASGSQVIVGQVPVNTPVNIVGAPIPGQVNAAGQPPQEALMYPVQWGGQYGWVAQWDLAGVPGTGQYFGNTPPPSASTASQSGAITTGAQTQVSGSGISQPAAETTAPSYQVAG